MDTFPYESWDDAIAGAAEGEGFFTFGPGGNTATILLTIIGFVLMLAAFYYWTYSEKQNLENHAARLSDDLVANLRGK